MDISEDIKLQREIGKQLLLVSILKSEAERAKRIGITSIQKEDVEEWTSMSKDEVDDFCYTCQSLLKEEMAMMAAGEYRRTGIYIGEKDRFLYAYYTYVNLEPDFLKGYSEHLLDEYCKANAKANYESFAKHKGYSLEKRIKPEYDFRKMLVVYLEYFISTVSEALSHGYDWDVVSQMIWCDLTFEDYKKLSEEYA